MEFAVTILLAAVGVFLALRSSSWAIDYAIWLIALNRFIRRLVDFYFNGQFNPLSPISLTPLMIGGALFLGGFLKIHHLHGNNRKIFYCLFGALGLGFAVGLIRTPVGAIFSLGEWMAGVGAMLFIATLPTAATARDRWMKTAGYAASVVAIYGLWQFFTIPPWDAMWLKQSGMMGYMGIPKPMQMTCFSTMNERGVVAMFMAFGILPILLNKQWRNALSWPIAILCLAAMMITYVRTSFIILVLVAVIQPLLAKGRGSWQIIGAALILMAAAQFGLSKLPGADAFSERWSNKALTGKGSSLSGRLGIYSGGITRTLTSPLGSGLGSSGMAARVNDKGSGNVGDAGYLQIFAQFGWVGGGLFFFALWLIWREACERIRWESTFKLTPPDPFFPAARALLAGMLVFLFVTDAFAGFSLAWVILGGALNFVADPKVRVAIRQHLRKQNPAGPVELARPVAL